MTITLLPHQEKALEAALKSGVINSVEEFVDSAIAHLPPSDATVTQPDAKSLYELLAPIRGLFTDNEIDTLFARKTTELNPTPSESRP